MIKGKSASETEQSAVCHFFCSSPVPPLLPYLHDFKVKFRYPSMYLFSYKFQVRVLQALFPPLLLVLFKALLAPIGNGQLASMMVGELIASQTF